MFMLQARLDGFIDPLPSYISVHETDRVAFSTRNFDKHTFLFQKQVNTKMKEVYTLKNSIKYPHKVNTVHSIPHTHFSQF